MDMLEKPSDTGYCETGNNRDDDRISSPYKWSWIIDTADQQGAQREGNILGKNAKVVEDETGNNCSKS